jgi:hypothetical protein
VCFHLPLVRSGLSRAIFFVAARISSLQRRFRCRLIFPRLDLFSRSWFVFSISFAAGLFFWFLPLSKLRLFLPPSRFRSAAGQAFDLRLVFTPPISSRVRFRSRAGPRRPDFQLPGTEFIRYSILPLGIFSLRSRSPLVRWTESRQLHSSSSFFSVSVFVFLVWFSFPVQVGRPRRIWHVLVCVMTSTHNDQTTSLIHCTARVILLISACELHIKFIAWSTPFVLLRWRKFFLIWFWWSIAMLSLLC